MTEVRVWQGDITRLAVDAIVNACLLYTSRCV